MDVCLENYELYYQMFIAEQELYDTMIGIAEGYINESSGIISLNEGFKETISKYITKISTALENAWNKFKAIVSRDKDKSFLSKIADKIINSKPDFAISNYQEINTNAYDNLVLVPFNYEQMKDDLDSIESFQSKYYGNYMKDSNKSLKENITALTIVNRRDNVQCTGEMLNKMYNFLVKEFPSKMGKLENDLKTMSNSNKMIENLSSTVSSNNESILFYRYYLTEEENKQLPATTNNKQVSANSNTLQFKDGENVKNNGSFIKRVTNYIKVCVDVITGKMAGLKNIFSHYMKIITHYISPKSVEGDNSINQTTQVTTTKTTINT